VEEWSMKKSKEARPTTSKPGCSAMTSTMKKPSMGLCCAEVSSRQNPTKSNKTRVTAHIDCGFTNNLFIRGEGVSTLSWNKGTEMKNNGPNEWVWESDRPFSTMQFKVLVNDKWYEQGNNHSVAFGQQVDFSPQF
jgi:hypothetical protein